MAVSDTKAPFLRIPWAASLLNRPNVICRVPGSRKPKSTLEDSLFAEILNTPRTIVSCISFYQKPADGDEMVAEVSTLITVGDGLNGHPDILHGGIVASILDEGMGILQTVNHERDHLSQVGKGLASGELPPHGIGTFTATLDIRYLKPVQTPGSLIVTARYTKRDGRKEWIHAEIKQHIPHREDDYGEEVLCATGDALFIAPKAKASKL
jgi:acyl-coenzyme A thioesterase PaaI-like protein